MFETDSQAMGIPSRCNVHDEHHEPNLGAKTLALVVSIGRVDRV